MIFVTVGTHEQQFDRLIKKIDELVENKAIKGEVFIQLGYCNYIPKHCKYKKMISIDEMYYYSKNAKIIITHGGPGSIMLPITYNKVPIVVPRQLVYKEHVDNHQVEFAKHLQKEGMVISIFDINTIEDVVKNYENYCKGIDNKKISNTAKFVEQFNREINKLFYK